MNATEQLQEAEQPQPMQQPQQPERRHAWVGILATIVGAILLLGFVGTTFVNGLWDGSIRSFNEQLKVESADTLTIEIDYGQIDVEFSDSVSEVTLDVTGRARNGESPLTLTNSGGEVRVTDQRGNEWFNNGPWGWDDLKVEGVLTVPAALEGKLNLNLDVGAGSVTVNGKLDAINASVSTGELLVNEQFNTGEFKVEVGQLTLEQGGSSADIQVSAGSAVAFGSYDSLVARVDIGSFQLDGTVQDLADVQVDAGEAYLVFKETMPLDTQVETSIGDLSIQMPQVPIQLEAPRHVRAQAEGAGYDIDGGPDAPRVLVMLELGDVNFY